MFFNVVIYTPREKNINLIILDVFQCCNIYIYIELRNIIKKYIKYIAKINTLQNKGCVCDIQWVNAYKLLLEYTE
jgi:hypothetical protein